MGGLALLCGTIVAVIWILRRNREPKASDEQRLRDANNGDGSWAYPNREMPKAQQGLEWMTHEMPAGHEMRPVELPAYSVAVGRGSRAYVRDQRPQEMLA